MHCKVGTAKHVLSASGNDYLYGVSGAVGDLTTATQPQITHSCLFVKAKLDPNRYNLYNISLCNKMWLQIWAGDGDRVGLRAVSDAEMACTAGAPDEGRYEKKWSVGRREVGIFQEGWTVQMESSTEQLAETIKVKKVEKQVETETHTLRSF